MSSLSALKNTQKPLRNGGCNSESDFVVFLEHAMSLEYAMVFKNLCVTDVLLDVANHVIHVL